MIYLVRTSVKQYKHRSPVDRWKERLIRDRSLDPFSVMRDAKLNVPHLRFLGHDISYPADSRWGP